LGKEVKAAPGSVLAFNAFPFEAEVRAFAALYRGLDVFAGIKKEPYIQQNAICKALGFI
jgi:hypothetical protein